MRSLLLAKISCLMLCALLLTMGSVCADFDFDDMELIEQSEQEELLQEARDAAGNWNFSSANSYLDQARQKAYSPDAIAATEQIIADSRADYAAEQARIAAAEQARIAAAEKARIAAAQNRNSGGDSEGDLQKRCAFLLGNMRAWSACTKNESNLMGMDTLMALYATRKQCDYLAGAATSGMSYLCSHPEPNGCIALDASQDTINACYQCGGSNLWLRVYATGTVLRCY
jgi:hypothetical protein